MARGFLQSFVVALSFFVAAIIAVPSSLYQSGSVIDGLGFPNFLLWGALFAVVISIIVAAIAKGSNLFQRVILVAAIALLIKGLLLKSEVPVLDGDATFSPAWGSSGVFSVVSLIFAILIGSAIVWWRGRSVAPVVLFIAVAVAAQPLLHLENWQPTSEGEKPDREPLFSLSKDQKNVIVILIDTFQSDVFAQVVEEEGLESEFDGFTYFYNTIGHAPYTQISLIPIYSGKPYSGGSIKSRYEQLATDSIFSDMKEAGYHVSLAGHYYYRICPADTCMYRWDMVRSFPFASSLSKFIQAVETSYLTVAPVALQPALYNSGKGVLAALVPVGESDAATGSIAALDAFSDGMTTNSQVPTFKFVHLMTMHSPIVLDENCRNVGSQRLIRENYRTQAICAVNGVVRFLKALRSHGVYETSDIVLMADHGASLSGNPPSKKFLDKVQPLAARSGRFTPLFAVKPAGPAGKNMELSSAPLQLMDLRATLCAMINCKTRAEGVDAFAPPSTRRRPVLVYGSDAHRFTAENDRLPDGVKTVVIDENPESVDKAFQ